MQALYEVISAIYVYYTLVPCPHLKHRPQQRGGGKERKPIYYARYFNLLIELISILVDWLYVSVFSLFPRLTYCTYLIATLYSKLNFFFISIYICRMIKKSQLALITNIFAKSYRPKKNWLRIPIHAQYV